MATLWQQHAWVNRVQTLLLILALLGISALAGALLFGRDGLWIALAASVVALLIEPAAAWRLTLRLYRARPIHPEEAPELWRIMARIAERADLPSVPVLHYVPSPIVNAFAVGSRERSAIALTDGLLRSLTLRELAGVLAHEASHIAHGDLRVMGLADFVSRLTSLFALIGQVLLLLALPWVLSGAGEVNWWGLLFLVASPHLALLAQLGLSRVREFDADLKAAVLTGDPEGLASALAKIERVIRSWRRFLMAGWGNPEPSWLRTHPPSGERVRRLLALGREGAGGTSGPEPLSPAARGWPDAHRRGPRWRFGGTWY
jgi:heat shock protein HtpX